MHIGLFGWVVIILLVYFLIIRPMTRRRDYGRRSNQGYGNNGYGNGYNNGYNSGYNNGYMYGEEFGERRPDWGMAAGGFVAGALLDHLLEEGRIDQSQYDYYNSLDQNQMMNDLLEQNIMQQDEINDLQRQMGDSGMDSYQVNGFDNSGSYDGQSYDQDNGYQDNGNDNSYDNGNDNSYDSSNDSGGYDDGGGYDGGSDGGDWL